MSSTTPALHTFRPFINLALSACHSLDVDADYDAASLHSDESDGCLDSESSSSSSSSDFDDDQASFNSYDEPSLDSDPSSESEDEPEPDAWAEGLEAYPSEYERPVRLRRHICIGRVGGKRRLPFANSASFDTFVKTPTIFVDKIAHVRQLCATQFDDGRLTLIRRPSGFGKTSFLSMAQSVLDLNRCEEFCQVYGSSPLKEALVLSLNLDKLPSEPRAFRAGLLKHINSALRFFLLRYRTLLNLSQHEINRRIYDDTRRSGFEWVMEVVGLSEYSVVLLIDNLNAPLIKSTRNNIDEILSIIELSLLRPVSRAMDEGAIMGGFAVSLPISEEPEWTQRGRTLGFREHFFDAIAVDGSSSNRTFGFCKEEIAGLAAECLAPEDVEPFVDLVVETLDDWFYSYSMSDVLAMLRKRIGQVDYPSTFPFSK